MVEKIKLSDIEYDVQNLSDKAKILVNNMQFITKRLNELNNMQALLTRAKISYIESLKKEIISKKAGLSICDE